MANLGFKGLFVILCLFFYKFIFSSSSFFYNNKEGKIYKKEISKFNSINVSNGIIVNLTQSDTENLSYSISDTNYVDNIVIEIKNEVLFIYMKDLKTKLFGNKLKVEVNLSFVNLSKIKVSSSASIIGKNNFNCDNIKIEQSSSSDVNIIGKVNDLNLVISSGSDFKSESIVCDNMKVEQSSGSDINITGKVNDLNLVISSGSDFKGENLYCKTAKIDASSGSEIEINVEQNLYVKAQSGACIKYIGNPKIDIINISSGGNLKKM